MCLFPRGTVLRLRGSLEVSDTILFSPGGTQLQARVRDGDLVLLMCVDQDPQVLRSAWPLYCIFFSSPLEAQQGSKLCITLTEANLVMAPLVTSHPTLLSCSLGLSC